MVNKTFNTLLICQCRHQQEGPVQTHPAAPRGLEVGLGQEARQWQLLSLILLRGNIRIVKCLLSQTGIDIDPTDEQLSTPLSVAATYDNHNSVKLLLKKGAEVTRVDLQGHNVLHKAAREGNSKVVNIVIDHLKDDDEKLRSLMRQKDARGNTPFMLAVQVTLLSLVNTMLTLFSLVSP